MKKWAATLRSIFKNVQKFEENYQLHVSQQTKPLSLVTYAVK